MVVPLAFNALFTLTLTLDFDIFVERLCDHFDRFE